MGASCPQLPHTSAPYNSTESTNISNSFTNVSPIVFGCIVRYVLPIHICTCCSQNIFLKLLSGSSRWPFPQPHNSLLCSSEVCLQKANEKITAERVLNYCRHFPLPLPEQEVNKSQILYKSLPCAAILFGLQVDVGRSRRFHHTTDT